MPAMIFQRDSTMLDILIVATESGNGGHRRRRGRPASRGAGPLPEPRELPRHSRSIFPCLRQLSDRAGWRDERDEGECRVWRLRSADVANEKCLTA
jgi:hypothetical protein